MSQNRIVTLIDMDCFYCQVEIRANPSLKGKPVAVVQYNTWKGGGIIAVNYEARNVGVTRGMRGDEALKRCPDIQLISVPEVRGKADLTRYRDAGREVIAVLCEYSSCVEKASIDEAYLDLTDIINQNDNKPTINKLKSTFIVGYNSNQEGTKQWLNDIYTGGISDESVHALARAAVLVERIRAKVLTKTSFHCSAGISHNKILAKLACGINKPDRQTVLPISSAAILFSNLPLNKIRNLGGKFGNTVKEQLDITTVGQVAKFSLKELQQKFGDKNGTWLYNIARGIDEEPVKPRLVSKSIGCCKNFKGPSVLTSKQDVKCWLTELATEIVDRIQDDLVVNKRRATLLVVSAHQEVEYAMPFSRSTVLKTYNREEIITNSFALLCKCNKSSADSLSWSPPLKYLGLSVGKFVEVKDGANSLFNFFKPVLQRKSDELSVDTSSSTKDDKGIILYDKITNSSVGEISLNLVTDSKTENNSLKYLKPNKGDTNSDENPNEVEVYDYQNSFFCKYFAKKKFHQKFLNSTVEKQLNVQVDIHVSNKGNDTKSTASIEEPIPSTSKDIIDASVNSISIPKLNISNSSVSRDNLPIPSSSYHIVSVLKSNIDEEPLVNNEASNVVPDNATVNANELTELCAECNQNIRLIEFLEHLDHHVACKLQEELNASAIRSVNTSTDSKSKLGASKSAVLSNFSKKTYGKKRKYNKSKNQISPVKHSVPITSFFNVKPQLGGATND